MKQLIIGIALLTSFSTLAAPINEECKDIKMFEDQKVSFGSEGYNISKYDFKCMVKVSPITHYFVNEDNSFEGVFTKNEMLDFIENTDKFEFINFQNNLDSDWTFFTANKRFTSHNYVFRSVSINDAVEFLKASEDKSYYSDDIKKMVQILINNTTQK